MKECKLSSAWGKMAEGLTHMEPMLYKGCLARCLCGPACLVLVVNPISCLWLLFSFLRKRNRFRLVSSFAYVHTLVSGRGWTTSQFCLTPKFLTLKKNKNTLCYTSQVKIFQGQVGNRNEQNYLGCEVLGVEDTSASWTMYSLYKGGSFCLVPGRYCCVGMRPWCCQIFNWEFMFLCEIS